MQLVKAAESRASVLRGAERFGNFAPRKSGRRHQPVCVRFEGGASREPRSFPGVIQMSMASSVRENICFRARSGLYYIRYIRLSSSEE